MNDKDSHRDMYTCWPSHDGGDGDGNDEEYKLAFDLLADIQAKGGLSSNLTAKDLHVRIHVYSGPAGPLGSSGNGIKRLYSIYFQCNSAHRA